MHAQIVGGHLEGAAGARGSFLKNQGDVFPRIQGMGNALLFFRLQFRRQVQQPLNLRRAQVQQLQKVFL